MYNPAHFALTDPAALQRVIHQHPLGMLVTHGPEGWTPTTSRSSTTRLAVSTAP